MRHYFLDASALTKLYAVEPGSRRVKDMLRSAMANPPASRIIVCDLSHPETLSAVVQTVNGPDAAKHGLSRFTANRVRQELVQAMGPTSTFVLVNATGVMAQAAEIVWKHRIKASDAVQVAAALRARSLVPIGAEFYFVGSDGKQNAASQKEGLAVLDPTV